MPRIPLQVPITSSICPIGVGVAEECPIVLNAIIESYQDFLTEAYHNVSDDQYGNDRRRTREYPCQSGRRGAKEHNDYPQRDPDADFQEAEWHQ